VKSDLDFNAVDTILGVHGIGPVKANDLIKNHGIHSISELRAAVGQTPSLLNKQQMIGLQNYEDIQERIPRAEMTLHEEHILKIVADVIDGIFTAALVGSYRRGAPTSGDIDVLIGYPKEMTAKEAEKKYFEIIKRLQDTYKSFDILAKGEKKCMAVARLASSGELSKARRLDLLLTPSDEYPYALLYFTGSDKFNIQVRKKAAAKGFSLSEHKLHPLNQITKKEGIDRFFKPSKDETPESQSAETPHPPHMKTEKDILDFLEVSSEFACPKNRNIH
jgi:DNA polymerase beta